MKTHETDMLEKIKNSLMACLKRVPFLEIDSLCVVI
jgi:hypothetical protein